MTHVTRSVTGTQLSKVRILTDDTNRGKITTLSSPLSFNSGNQTVGSHQFVSELDQTDWDLRCRRSKTCRGRKCFRNSLNLILKKDLAHGEPGPRRKSQERRLELGEVTLSAQVPTQVEGHGGGSRRRGLTFTVIINRNLPRPLRVFRRIQFFFFFFFVVSLKDSPLPPSSPTPSTGN